jgi:hypothetical protein
MTPFIVSSQVNDSVIERLKTEGFRMGVDLILERRQQPYLTAALFQQYVTTVLITFSDFGNGELFDPHETRELRHQTDYFPATHDSDIPGHRFEPIWCIGGKKSPDPPVYFTGY